MGGFVLLERKNLMTLMTLPHKRIGVAVIRNDRGEILIDRRLDKGEMAGLWEFPGGKVEAGETVQACIAREIKEEINLDVQVGDRLILIEHDYPKFKVSLYVHWCEVVGGEAQAIECQEILWVQPQDLGNYSFPEANLAIINAIQQA
jgi:8-oxo-dGTP diphosphatase